jgi:acyl-CoA reductase-like NAD-dependent aldehyde dehydrogenase
MPAHPFYVDGIWRMSASVRQVRNPYDGHVAGEVCQAGAKDVEDAIASATRVFAETRKLPSFQRSEILSTISRILSERREDFTRLITEETGKPISLSRSEVDRSVFTFSIAAEEARRNEGTVLPLDLNAHSLSRFGLVRRFPLGPVGAITPFNFPLNLVAHKVAPAIASGNPVVLKPSSSAPLTALLLAEIVDETSLPKGGFNVIPCLGNEAAQLYTDKRIKLITFTGSPAIGWPIKSQAGKMKVVLELGGNAGVIVEADADLDLALTKILAGGFANAGQSCISVQRIYVHTNIWAAFIPKLVHGAKGLQMGDPWNEATVVGPMITEQAAQQVEAWISEAVAGGARILCGGKRKGAMLEPTILSDVRPDMNVCCKEVFAPVVIVEEYKTFEDALDRVNDSDFGLQAGVFTQDFRKVFRAYEELEVGGVVINDVSTYRIDHMPYGGVKDSGFGREGIRYAMEEMTELKLLAVNPL